MSSIIKPHAISGFPEFLPSEQIVLSHVLEIIRIGFERFGFSPIETSAVEKKEILRAKGDKEREIYALSRLVVNEGENADTDLALHFDLTVPLARYVALYKDKLAFPFRRYQIQKVWRGEKAQAGRYREFCQCDIDVVGRGSLSLLHDAEIPSVIYYIFRKMQIGHFVIRLNNRKILEGFLRHIGVPEEKFFSAMKVIDKLDRVGRQQVMNELMSGLGFSLDIVNRMLDLVGIKSSDLRALDELEKMDVNEDFLQGIVELRTVMGYIQQFDIPSDYVQIDLGVVRDLNYYTGTVYETTLVNYPEIGSICSGGRYENLTSYFGEEKLPGVGISIGLTRLVVRLIESGLLKVGPATVAAVLVTMVSDQYLANYLMIGHLLRDAGIPTEVYLENSRLGEQLRYANKKGFKVAIIAGQMEFSVDSVKLRNLSTGDEIVCSTGEMVQYVEKIISGLS